LVHEDHEANTMVIEVYKL